MTHQRRENLTGAAIGDPTEDTGEVTEITAPGRTRRERTTVVAKDTVAEEAVMLVGNRTGLISEAEVREGVMAISPTPSPPHQDGQRMQGGVQNCWGGGRLSEKEKLIGRTGGKEIFVRPYHQFLTVRPCHQGITMINRIH